MYEYIQKEHLLKLKYTFQSKLIGIISKNLRSVMYFRDPLQIFLNSTKGKICWNFFLFTVISLLSLKVKNKRTYQTIAAPCMFLCTRVFLYASYSLLLIPNKFWMCECDGGVGWQCGKKTFLPSKMLLPHCQRTPPSP